MKKYITLTPFGDFGGVLGMDTFPFAFSRLTAFFGGIFLVAGDGTGRCFGFTFIAESSVLGVAFGKFPAFFLDKSSGWIFGSTPPDAMVTCFNN